MSSCLEFIVKLSSKSHKFFPTISQRFARKVGKTINKNYLAASNIQKPDVLYHPNFKYLRWTFQLDMLKTFPEVPETPRSCLVRNASHGDGLEVSCIAGKDGGLHQSFVLEVSDISLPPQPPGATTLSDQGQYMECYVCRKVNIN